MTLTNMNGESKSASETGLNADSSVYENVPMAYLFSGGPRTSSSAAARTGLSWGMDDGHPGHFLVSIAREAAVLQNATPAVLGCCCGRGRPRSCRIVTAKVSQAAPILRSAEFIPLQRSPSPRHRLLSGADLVREMKRTKVRAPFDCGCTALRRERMRSSSFILPEHH